MNSSSGFLTAEGLLEVAQPVAAALDVEDIGLVQQPIEDGHVNLAVLLGSAAMLAYLVWGE